MAKPPPHDTEKREVLGAGFLLSQLGAHSSMAFAQRIAPTGLTPPHVGLLRMIGIRPGRSQQAIADQFGLPPSRMVAFIDELEAHGLVERRRDVNDRRVHLLHLAPAGEAMLAELSRLAREAERELLKPLSPAERTQLKEMLNRIAESQQLTEGVHPGYGKLRH